jgi:hypothetical protein
LRASATEKRSESQPGCRSCRCKPVASCSRSGNNDCKDLVFLKGNTRAATRKSELFGQNAKALCRSRRLNRNPARGASQSGFCGCQSDRNRPGESGKRSAIDDDVPPELSPGLPGSRNSGTELFGKSWHERTIRRQSSAEVMQAEARLTLPAWRESRRTIGEDQL